MVFCLKSKNQPLQLFSSNFATLLVRVFYFNCGESRGVYTHALHLRFDLAWIVPFSGLRIFDGQLMVIQKGVLLSFQDVDDSMINNF
jgi:hypothetical protein